jgi:glycosyltransferase involved in cell wall biosynthesis
VHIVHVISGLPLGGAQTALHHLVAGMDRRRFGHTVISLTTEGIVGPRLRAAGAEVVELGMRPGWAGFSGMRALVAALRASQPGLVQSWMYHADLLGLVAARFVGNPPVVWNIRGARRSVREFGLATATVVKACRLFSRGPAAVVVNSEAGRRDHQRMGYRPRAWVVIPNGVDGERFRPDAHAREKVRSHLGMETGALVVGCVGRDHPVKRHATIVDAVARLRQEYPSLRLLMIGEGLDERNQDLTSRIKALGLGGIVHRVGPQDEVWRWMTALDMLVSASTTEGFPNVVGEAMACGIPCVVTDVGDSALLVGEAGTVVPVDGVEGLADGIRGMARKSPQERRDLGARARARVLEHYSVPRMIASYERLYDEILQGGGKGAG